MIASLTESSHTEGAAVAMSENISLTDPDLDGLRSTPIRLVVAACETS